VASRCRGAAWHENDLKHLRLKRKEFAQAAQNFNCSSTEY
jgi:hypothetical protein